MDETFKNENNTAPEEPAEQGGIVPEAVPEPAAPEVIAPEAAPEPAWESAPDPQDAFPPEPAPAPMPQPEPFPQPEPMPQTEPMPQPEPIPRPEPMPQPEPQPNFGSQEGQQNVSSSYAHPGDGRQQDFGQSPYGTPGYEHQEQGPYFGTQQDFSQQPNYNAPPQMEQTPYYGQPPYGTTPPADGEKKTGMGFGIASCVCGVLALVLFCTCLNIPLAIASIICGVIQLVQYRDKILAAIGIIASALSIVLFIVAMVVIMANVSSPSNLDMNNLEEFLEENQSF